MTFDLSNVRAVIFDLDGLMIDSEPIALEVWRSILAPFGVTPSADVYRRVIGLEPIRGVEILIAEYHLAAAPLELLETYWEQRTEVMASGIQAREGLDLVMDWFQARGILMGVASNSPQFYVERIVTSIGVNDRLESVLGSDQVGRGKPAPDVYLAVANELGVLPGSCLAVEDSPAGVAAAKAAGMTCMAIPSSEVLERDFSQADLSFDSLISLYIQLCS